MGWVFRGHKGKVSNCSGKPTGRESGYFSPFPTLGLTMDGLVSFWTWILLSLKWVGVEDGLMVGCSVQT